jgi:uncharacterized protein YeaO (DUF488 family)
MIKLKRVYEKPVPSDGTRVLVDRLWSRGLTKELASIDGWRRDLVPSTELRNRYGHDRTRFSHFRERYRMEVFRCREDLATLAIQGERKKVTLFYAAKDPRDSNAAILKGLLVEVLNGGRPRRIPRRLSSTQAGRRASKALGSR